MVEVEKEGEKYKEWQIGNSRGVIIEHKNKKEVVNGLQATFIGKSGTVYKFDLGKDKDGNRRTLKLNSADKKEAQALRNIEYAYAMTTEKAQGLGVKNVITVENTKKNANQNLVDISRTVKELKINSMKIMTRTKFSTKISAGLGKIKVIRINAKILRAWQI